MEKLVSVLISSRCGADGEVWVRLGWFGSVVGWWRWVWVDGGGLAGDSDSVTMGYALWDDG